VSSGRRSARRPREYIDLSQPEQALEESMVTVNYDDLLRDIQLWIYDLEGASGDVNKALEVGGRVRRARVLALREEDRARV
jgi:hypothetical protein